MQDNLKIIKNMYESGKNIIEYFATQKSSLDRSEMIMISYDFQAGSYIEKAKNNPEQENKVTDVYSSIINEIFTSGAILEVGVGEATTFSGLIPKLTATDISTFGFDISYSRMAYARRHLNNKNISYSEMLCGNMFNSPFMDNSIDVVYTSHTLEPNGGKEENALRELYRITKEYLVLFEPIYEFADNSGKVHMEKHGYIKGLYKTANKLGMNVVEYKMLFPENSLTSNNTGVLIIKKDIQEVELHKDNQYLACPITKTPLEKIKGNYYCADSMLLYPVVDSVPCLLPDNAIVATHYLSF
jgi:ubiquinone/menaquinone biosynthesis C-methylase UbiE/uncharacterized protein YbaR (Trm112 family)